MPRYAVLFLRNRRRWLFLGLCILLAAGAWLTLRIAAADADASVPPVLLVAPWLATFGWALTIYMTRGNERRKMTIDLLLRHQMDRSIEEHRYRIHRIYPPFAPLDKANAAAEANRLYEQYRSWQRHPKQTDDDGIPVVYSIIQVLNFYEFIAVSVRKERIDEGIAFDTFRSLTKNMAEKFQPFIKRSRQPGDDGNRPKTYGDLVWLTKRWHQIDLDC